MKQIGLYHPKHSSSLVYLNEGDDLTKWIEIGYRKFHDNNKGVLFIDWQPLFDWINKQIFPANTNLYTIPNIKFDIDMSGNRPEIISPNIVEHAGVFASVCETVVVGFFGLGMDELGFAATVSMRYTSWSGGSNGMNIGEVYYDHKNKQWDFTSTKMRTLTYRQNG